MQHEAVVSRSKFAKIVMRLRSQQTSYGIMDLPSSEWGVSNDHPCPVFTALVEREEMDHLLEMSDATLSERGWLCTQFADVLLISGHSTPPVRSLNLEAENQYFIRCYR